MTDTPLYAETLRALAGRYAREAVRAGLAWADDAPRCSRCGTLLRDGTVTMPCPLCPTTRLQILNGSALVYAVAAGA